MRPFSRRLFVFALLISSLAVAIPATAATSLSVSVTSSVTNPGDALLIGAAALFFGLDTSVSMQFRTSTGSPTAAISLFYVSGESQVAPESVVIERKKGRGWGALAKGKMPPGLVGKWKNSGDPFSYNDKDFETGISIHFLATYYAVSEDNLVLWVRRGISLPDLALCLNLSSRTKVAPSTIVELKLQGHGWTQLATRYGVTVDLLKQPVPPKAKYNKAVPGKSKGPQNSAPASKNNGNGKGKGK